MSQDIKVQSVYKPKRKPNLSRWMGKHNVSSSVTSLEFATFRAIEADYINSEYAKNNEK